jgi:hypothetical protein
MLRVRGGRTFRRIWDERDPEFDAPSAVTQSPEEFERALESLGDGSFESVCEADLLDRATPDHAVRENTVPENEHALQSRAAD